MQLEARDQRRRGHRLGEPGDGRVEEIEHRRMGIALGQQPAQRGEVIEPVERVRAREKAGGPQLDRFDDIVAEMLVEPRAPGRAHPVAGLQHRLEPAPGAAAHETEMPPVLARHQLGDRIGLAMAPRAEHDCDVAPLHRCSVSALLRFPHPPAFGSLPRLRGRVGRGKLSSSPHNVCVRLAAAAPSPTLPRKREREDAVH